ncbi:MAG: hypothetical protein MUE51_01775 [Thermoleophilia bacterium]|jgi:hypothetical protein|nr:hypothetical protein [Thermoleophilia bacterium]
MPYGWNYAALCLFQGLLVAMPWRPWRLVGSRLAGLLIPLVALAGGVALIRAGQGGAEAVAGLATFAAPPLAAAVGWAWRWPLPWLGPPVAAACFALAWRGDGLDADAAGLVLVGGACLTLAALIAAVAPREWIAAGLVVVAAVDVVLVFWLQQVQPATEALRQVVPPAVAVPGGGSVPLPSLQDAEFGRAIMGWMDVLAPALLATVLAGRTRVRLLAAGVTAAAALAWGLMLGVADSVPATVPVVAGLLAAVAAGALARRTAGGDPGARRWHPPRA